MEKRKFELLRKSVLMVAAFVFFGYCPLCAYAENPPIAQNQKTTEETAKMLQELTQYEIDGSFLISQCIDNIKNQAIKDKLLTIKSECEDNIKELSTLVRKYGREAPDYTKDFKGYFMEGYAAMRGAFTDQGALKALRTNLNLTLKAFQTALTSALPVDVKETITKVYENKKKALQYVEGQV